MSCTVYLIRHGIAEAHNASGDADRRLTPDGARKMHRAALGLKRLGIVPDVVLTSPLRRAEETATLVAAVLAPDLQIVIYPPLACGNPTADVLNGLREHRQAHHLLLVGHQPDLGDLASHLLTGSASVMPLPFKKGAVAAIVLPQLPPRSAGVLEWFLTPKQLRLIGRGPR